MSEYEEPSNDAGEPPLQFGLRTLLLLQALCAVFFAAVMLVGVFAVLAAFLGTIVFSGVSVQTKNAPLKRMTIHLMYGIVLPCLCLLFDPFVLREDGMCNHFGGSALRVTAYAAITLQMLTLLWWLLFGSKTRRLSGVLAGILLCGTLTAVGIGLALVPWSLLGFLVMGVGALGFVPFFTARVFYRNTVAAARRARRCTTSREFRLWYLVGVIIALGVPLLAYWLFGDDLLQLIPSLNERGFFLPFSE